MFGFGNQTQPMPGMMQTMGAPSTMPTPYQPQGVMPGVVDRLQQQGRGGVMQNWAQNRFSPQRPQLPPTLPPQVPMAQAGMHGPQAPGLLQAGNPSMSMGQVRGDIAHDMGYPTAAMMLHDKPELRPYLRGAFSKTIDPSANPSLQSLMAQYQAWGG